jgi:hypothetical protein
MPVYEYIDERTGRTVIRVSKVSERDCVPPNLKRVRVPRSVVFGGSRLGEEQDPCHVYQAGKKGLREIEIAMGTSETVRKVGFSRDHLRRVWNV